MKIITSALIAGLVSCPAWIGAPAQAQESAYSSWVSRQAAHAANVRAIQAQRDQHAANVAALNGDYGAARAFSHAADIRRAQAYGDARYSDRADRAARLQRYWGD